MLPDQTRPDQTRPDQRTVSVSRNFSFKYYDEAGNLIPNANPEDIPGLTVEFADETSELEIHRPHAFQKTSIVVGKNCRVVILGNVTVWVSLKILTLNQNEVHIGRNFDVRSADLVCKPEPGVNIRIGDDFLGSSQLLFRPSDGHTIYSLETKKPLNEPKSGIRVGNHVWFGQRVTCLKDAVVPDNCIVSFGSIVTRQVFPSNAVLGGVPAKVLKTGVNWSKLNTFRYRRKFASEFLVGPESDMS